MGIITKTNIYHISSLFSSPPQHIQPLPHTPSAVHRTPTLLQLHITSSLSLVRHTPMHVPTAIHSTVNPLPHPMHPHSPIHNLQQRSNRQRQRQHDVQPIPAADARGADAHDNKVDDREEGFEHRGDEVEGRFEAVGSREDDLGEDQDDAEGGEGDDDAEGCAVDCAVRVSLLVKHDLVVW